MNLLQIAAIARSYSKFGDVALVNTLALAWTKKAACWTVAHVLQKMRLRDIQVASQYHDSGMVRLYDPIDSYRW